MYTIPPYLKVRYSNLGSLYAPGGVHVLPALKLRSKEGLRNVEGYNTMRRIVAARGDWERLLGSDATLDQLIHFSGGHLRDLLRLLAEVLRRAPCCLCPRRLSLLQSINCELSSCLSPMKTPGWLSEIARSHQTALRARRNCQR